MDNSDNIYMAYKSGGGNFRTNMHNSAGTTSWNTGFDDGLAYQLAFDRVNANRIYAIGRMNYFPGIASLNMATGALVWAWAH